MQHSLKFTALFFTVTFFLFSCGSEENISWLDIEKDLQTQLIMAEDGDTIMIPEGHYLFSGSLSLDEKNNIVISGAGMDKTYLSFKGQTDGAEGIRLTNGRNITLQDLTVQDSKGDAVKAQEIIGLNFLNVRTTWSGKPKETNGAYGLYPVNCNNVLIDGCEASGASDAGIYVGQSNYVIVRNSTAFHNVAGIEIENTNFADVYNNTAYCNTGGILVFDLPDLLQKRGGTVRIFDNEIRQNNYRNFAPVGNIVANVPAGTGFMVLATSHVEVFNNKIIKHKTANASVVSYFITNEEIKDSLFDPYPKFISIRDNHFEQSWYHIPDMKNDLGKLSLWKFKMNTPDILYDGVVDPALTSEEKQKLLCISNNGDITFANIDFENEFANISKDLSKHQCNLPALAPVVFKTFSPDTLSLTETEDIIL